MWYVALPLLMLDLTHSTIWVGAAVACDFLPSTAFALIAGWLTDRLDLRLQLFALPCASALLCFALYLCHGLGASYAALIVLLVFLLQTAGEFYQTAFFASTPQLFDSSGLVRWNSIVVVMQQSCFVVAPALGGVLYALIGPYAIAGIDGISFMGLSLMAVYLPPLRDRARGERAPLLAGAMAGARWLLSQPSMRDTVVTSFLGNAILAVITVSFFAYLKGQLHFSSQLIGVFLSLQAVGGIIGGLATPWLSERVKPTGRAIFLMFLGGTAGLVLLALGLNNIVLFAFALVITFAAGAAEATLIISLRQRIIPSNILGRTYAVVRVVVLFGYTPAALITGFLAGRSQLWPLFAFAAAVSAGMMLFVRFGSIYRESR